MDGANRWQLFRYVTIPMIMPVVLTVFFIRMMDALRIVDEVWMLTGGGPGSATRFLGIHIWRVVFPKTDYGYGSAMSLLTLYFTIVLCWLVFTAITHATPGGVVMSDRKVRKSLGTIGTYAIWILATVLVLFPVYWMFLVSARSRVELFGAPTFVQTTFFADNYVKPLTDPTFQRYLRNSLIVSSANALLVVFLAVTATYALSRWRLRGDQSVFFWTITNRMAPPAAFMLPLFLLLTRVLRIGNFSLFDTRIGLILLYCTFNLPFAIWLLKGIMDGIPLELDEAALVDGAGLWTVLTRIIVPLAAPGIAITGVLSWVFAWNEYLFAATLTSVNARTVTTGLAEFVTVTGTNWGQMAAMSVISILPALLFLGLVQRYIVVGLTFGAVKG